MEWRVSRLEEEFREFRVEMRGIRTELVAIRQDIGDIKGRLGELNGRVSQLPNTWQMLIGVAAIGGVLIGAAKLFGH